MFWDIFVFVSYMSIIWWFVRHSIIFFIFVCSSSRFHVCTYSTTGRSSLSKYMFAFNMVVNIPSILLSFKSFIFARLSPFCSRLCLLSVFFVYWQSVHVWFFFVFCLFVLFSCKINIIICNSLNVYVVAHNLIQIWHTYVSPKIQWNMIVILPDLLKKLETAFAHNEIKIKFAIDWEECHHKEHQ